jgi:hypothetical protein
LRVTKWGLALSKDEEISRPGARDFGLASQINGLFNGATLSPAQGTLGRLGVMNQTPNDRRSLLAPFPGEPTPRPYDRVAETLPTRRE